jgi:hypothetical protein
MKKYTVDENGYITIPDNPISKSGVFQYLGKSISPDLEPNQIYNVYRPESALNNPETIESFRLTPWIPEHVMLGDNFTPAEVVGVQGVTGETVEFRNGTLFSKLKLFGEDLKKLIKAGLKELSCGFRCKWIIESGVTPNGQKYDVRQEQIRGNHLASVEEGRMGSDVRVAMDRATFALDSIDFNSNNKGEMMELKELASALKSLTKTVGEMKVAMDESVKKAGDMKQEITDMKSAKDKEKEKTAEDMEEEEKKKAEDMEKSKAMDSAIKAVKYLEKEVETLKSTAMDGNALMKAFAEKQNLASQASKLIGAFDHSDLDINGVAKYTLEKMGIACDSGQELPMLKGIIHAQQPQKFTIDNGQSQDSSEELKSENLDKHGL